MQEGENFYVLELMKNKCTSVLYQNLNESKLKLFYPTSERRLKVATGHHRHITMI
jgi:hypothetical protein